MFSLEQIKFFNEKGYLVIKKFFSKKEIKALQLEVKRIKDEGFFRNVATDGDGKTASKDLVNYQVIPLNDKSKLIRSLPFEKKVVDAVSSLIGNSFCLHLDQMFIKPPKKGIGTNWHQDNAYFKITNPLGGTAMWIAVDDSRIDNGTIHVIPKSFKNNYSHQRDPFSDHHIICEVSDDEGVGIELDAGGVLFFCFGTAHCTKKNNSNKERAGLALHFLNSLYISEINLEFNKSKKNLPFILGDKASGGLNEYGMIVSETWKDEVNKIIKGSN